MRAHVLIAWATLSVKQFRGARAHGGCVCVCVCVGVCVGVCVWVCVWVCVCGCV